MKRWLACALACGALALAGCGDDLSNVDGPVNLDFSANAGDMTKVDFALNVDMSPVAMAEVSVGDDFYAPKDVFLKQGGTVKWSWIGANPHTVTSDAVPPVFDSSPEATAGHTFSFTFPNTGSFPYHCLVHGLSMAGTITVE